jgi:HD superfamily phosphohydrolase
VEAIHNRFQEEVKHTNARPFKNILPITDYGTVSDLDETEILYYASPFVEGASLSEFLKKRIPTDAQFNRGATGQLHDLLLGLVDDLLAAVEELEEAHVIHMDIKPGNIMVLTDANAGLLGAAHAKETDRLFLIDLGAARSASLPAKSVPFIITRYFFPVHLSAKLKHHGRKVDHAELMKVGSKIDLYSVGRVLEYVWLDRVRRQTPRFSGDSNSEVTEARKERLYRTILEDDFEVVEGLISRLMEIGEAAFPTAGDARRAFQSVARRTSHSVFASRILTDQSSAIRIRLGRAMVRVAPPFDRIVDHPVFQRLRRLQQLTLLSEVFPDATHTRFSHSLYTFHLAKRFIRGLYRDTHFRMIFTQRDVEHVLAAALLHDIGQYPFSHTIEDLRKLGDLSRVSLLRQIKYDQELASEYMSRGVDALPSIGSILEDSGFSTDTVVYLFQKTAKDQHTDALSVGRDIISGAIDVDRVAYLAGDSDRSGMPYGAAMDIDGLVEALCVKPAGGGEDACLCIEEGGVSAVEAMLTAVYWMYRDVYWRHTNRGFMAAVKYAFEFLLRYDNMTFADYKDAVYGRSDWDALAYLHERLATATVRRGLEITNPLQTIVALKRFGYRRVFSLGADDGEAGALYRKVIAHVSPTLLHDITIAIAQSFPAAYAVRDGDILVDVPLKKRLRNAQTGPESTTETAETAADAGSKPPVWVRRRSRLGAERWKDLYSYSPLAGLLGRIEDHSGRKMRVFVSRALLERMSAQAKEALHTEVYGLLVSHMKQFAK